VVAQLAKAGFAGAVWQVHPRDAVFARIEDLPAPPDAVFIGINRDASIEAVEALSRAGAGGAVCFASGFAEVGDGQDRNGALLAAAGDMPILGPNCYGMINALDGALIWPDQHGCVPVARGVAILTQSSNIAINLTMQKRGLPIAYVITCGNQAQTRQAEIARALLDDDRVTAIGLHVEGFGDPRGWQDLARAAADRAVPLVALKVGQSAAAQAAAVSHTASLTGSDTGAQALLDHLGIARVADLASFLETLKVLHVTGRLQSNRIAAIACSGGEASLSADLAAARGLDLPPLTEVQRKSLDATLGPRVTLANPLDYHTYIWRNVPAMTDTFAAMIAPDLAMTLLVLDFPRRDRCDDVDWDTAVAAALAAKARAPGNLAVVASLPELMPEERAAELMAGGVVPLNGLVEAMNAVRAAAVPVQAAEDILPPGLAREAELIGEAEAKADLAAYGLDVPRGAIGEIETLCDWAAGRSGAFVLKSVGLAHKSDLGGVALGLRDAAAIRTAAEAMPGECFLIEEMIADPVAEILLGVLRDPAHGFVLTLGAGGVMTELMQDTVSLLVPASRTRIEAALRRLRIARLLDGYRGKPGADIPALLDAVEAVQAYLLANADRVEEVEVNPLICTPDRAIAVDALIRRSP